MQLTLASDTTALASEPPRPARRTPRCSRARSKRRPQRRAHPPRASCLLGPRPHRSCKRGAACMTPSRPPATTRPRTGTCLVPSSASACQPQFKAQGDMSRTIADRSRGRRCHLTAQLRQASGPSVRIAHAKLGLRVRVAVDGRNDCAATASFQRHMQVGGAQPPRASDGLHGGNAAPR